MASDALFQGVEARRSIYSLAKSSPIPDSRIQEIVSRAVKNAPSPFNVQSARAVILVGPQHDKLWAIADEVVKASVPEAAYKIMKPRIDGFAGAYGSVCWFEDEEKLDTLRAGHAAIKHVITEWSDHSNGMHQFITWTALTLEGLGCNLQHYNFSPVFTQRVQEEWNLPKTWTLKSQLVFGTPTAGRAMERTYLPVEDRVQFHK